jgi:ATP-dependent Clp protease ATP-binding subunit ClpX
VLLNTMYELPGRSDVGTVSIDAETVQKKAAPKLVPREPKAKRPRREAS